MLEMAIFWIGIAIVATALFMLFLDSFQSRRLWAVISLVLIVPLFIHMVLNWSEMNVRKALYVFIIGLLAVFVGISGGALSKLSILQEHEVVQALEEKIAPPEDTPLSNQQQADEAALGVEEDYDPLLTGSEYEQLETKEIVPEKINQVVRDATPTARYELVSEDERIHAINKRVRVILKDASVVEGILTEIVDNSLIVESEVNGGSLGLSYKYDQIQSVAVRLKTGEVLYEPEEEQEPASVPTQEKQPDAQLVPGQQEAVIEETEVSSEQNVLKEQVTPNVDEMPTDNKTEQQIPLDATEDKSAIETEVLEKVEEMVDDSKLLDNANGQ
ncbi:MAG: hypothetical protein AB8C40_02970 [Gammaproteobacteria bacterium]